MGDGRREVTGEGGGTGEGGEDMERNRHAILPSPLLPCISHPVSLPSPPAALQLLASLTKAVERAYRGSMSGEGGGRAE